jgi:tripartite-type tricarboxylate transporter receptor subunit TctC
LFHAEQHARRPFIARADTDGKNACAEQPEERFMNWLMQVVALCVALVLAMPAHAQRYPSRTIEIVVAYGPGGSTDQVARPIAQRLQERLGQSVIILNKPGANGTLGAMSVARAAPDGYTLYVGYTGETAIIPQISKTAKYSIEDFEPVAITGIIPLSLIVSKNIRANTLQEFIAEVRANPGKFTFGGGIGAPPHVMGAWFHHINNLNVTHIPYRGGGQAVQDVVGGHIDMFYGGVAAAKAAVASGSVKALAVTGDVRSSALPDVPTYKESGIKDAELGSWTIMFAPKGTPADVVALLRQETLAAIGESKLRDVFAGLGVDPSATQDVKAFIAEERAKYARVLQTLKITLD